MVKKAPSAGAGEAPGTPIEGEVRKQQRRILPIPRS